jgi:hypothetical protein
MAPSLFAGRGSRPLMEENMSVVRSWKSTVRATLLVAAILGCGPAPALAQSVALGRPTRDRCPPPPCISPEDLTKPPETPFPQVPETPSEAFRTPDERSVAAASLAYPMIGDLLSPTGGFRTVFVQGPPTFNAFGQPIPSTPTAVAFRIPSAGHNYKIADDESPRPVDRLIFTYNYYNDVNGGFNAGLNPGVGRSDVHQEVFGFEKTFLDRNASVGLRLPLYTLDNSGGSVQGIGGTFTDVGDLTVVTKFVLIENRETGSLFSGGMCITVPTGPTNFAGVPPAIIPQGAITTINGVDVIATPAHDTLLQPWLGGIWEGGSYYIHGFTALDIPTSTPDVTMLYNDIGVGYYLMRDRNPGRLLTGVVPTFEVHVNTPLNHRGSGNGVVGTPDWVDLVGGVIFELNHRSILTLAVGAPITGPKPYDLEGILAFNYRF